MNYLILIWIIGGLILMASEYLIPGFFIIFFGLGAVITGLLALLIPGLEANLPLQLLLWLLTSVSSLAVLRKYLAKVFKGRLTGDKEATDFSGQEALVTEKIPPGKSGRIKFQGTTWKAVSYDEKTLRKGEKVEILKKENMTIIVTKKIDSEDEFGKLEKTNRD
jgi:inner membrane protein